MTENNSPSNLGFPPFPDGAYVGVLGEVSKILAEYTEAPREFIYARLLVEVGLILSDRLVTDFGLITTAPRINLMKIGPFGTSKKSTADRLAHDSIKDALAYATEKMSNAVSTPTDFEWMQVIPGAGSAEGIEKVLANHSRVLVSYDEFGKFRAKGSIEGSTLTYMFTELFESTDYSNVTKSNSQVLKNVFLGLSVNCPLEEFDNLPGDMSDGGLLSRFLFVVADRRHRIAKPDDHTEELRPLSERLGDYFTKLDLKATKARRLSMTPEAKALWGRLDEVIEASEHTNRLDTIGQRLTTIFAFGAGKNVVDAEIVEAVFALLKYQKAIRELLRPNYGETRQARAEAAVIRYVQRQHSAGRVELSQSDIRRGTRIDRTYGMDGMRSALQSLVTNNALRFDGNKYSLGPEGVE
jgi:hypothetical protein